jgi:hypothetical protein
LSRPLWRAKIKTLPLPAFLVPEISVHANGTSGALEIAEDGPILVTLGILETVEQESLVLSIEGSVDGVSWLPDPMVTFPEKFYTGVSSVYIDAAGKGVRHLRASWKVNRWGRGDKTPQYKLYVFAEAV